MKGERFGEALRMEYVHDEDPEGVARVHDFGRKVVLIALPDGRVLLEHGRGKPLWEDFPGGDGP